MELKAAESPPPVPVSETVLDASTTRVRMESGEARSTEDTLGTLLGWALKAQNLLQTLR